MSTHVTVVGGGVAGLMVSPKLAKDGYQVTLLEAQSSLGAASSTHNHGWLHHSARYYLLTHGMEVVQQCQEGAEEILRLAPHRIEPCRGSYLITVDADRAHCYVQRCHEVGLSPHEVSVKDLQAREPALRRSPIQAAFAVSDRPFSPSVLLQTLYTAAVEAGVEVRCGTVVQEFWFESWPDCWRALPVRRKLR